jgi:hypothetical protein
LPQNSALVAIGREGDISRSSQIGRCSPESNRLLRCREMTLRANSDILHCGKTASLLAV